MRKYNADYCGKRVSRYIRNNHALIMNDLYTEMDRIGLSTHPVENDEYAKALSIAQNNPDKAEIPSSFIAYEDMGHGRKTYGVGKSNSLTMQMLYRMNFK